MSVSQSTKERSQGALQVTPCPGLGHSDIGCATFPQISLTLVTYSRLAHTKIYTLGAALEPARNWARCNMTSGVVPGHYNSDNWCVAGVTGAG